MTTILLETTIHAPIIICFNLSRSIELHELSTANTKEKAIKGRMKGLCEKGDMVTWRAKHFGRYHQLTMQINQMTPPTFFEDRMVNGIFKSIRHQHYFLEKEGITIMKDVFAYEVPFGIAGKLFDRLVLKKYMTNLLLLRNSTISAFAAGERWKMILTE